MAFLRPCAFILAVFWIVVVFTCVDRAHRSGGSPKVEEYSDALPIDAVSMLHGSIRTRKRRKDSSARNLVLFFDDVDSSEGKECQWPVGGDCETNIVELWRLASVLADEDAPAQITFYRPGDDEGDVGQSNESSRVKASSIAGYSWLLEHHHPQDRIFIFGFGHGALSARYLQGLIHHGGPVPGGGQSSLSPDAEVTFLGLFDALLRPIWSSSAREPLLALTASVRSFAHAMAISEVRGHLTTGELVADAATRQMQAWFMGLHSDVGGGNPSKGPARISLGWMADHAEEAGLLLPDGWRSAVAPVDFVDDVHAERGPSASEQPEALAHLLAIRNPARCRNESGRGGPVAIHQSVLDRMQSNTGWVPLPWCCESWQESLADFGIEWVTTAHYEAAAVVTQQPQWVRVTLGRLSHAEVPEMFWAPRYYVTAQNWHSSVPIEEDAGAHGGCCSVHRGDPIWRDSLRITRHGSFWWPSYTANLDFTGLELILPVERALADQILIEVHEDDLTNDDFVGRVALNYSDVSAASMQAHDIDGSPGDAELEVCLEFVDDDASIQGLLSRDGRAPAQCGWAWAHLGRGAGLCGHSDSGFDRALEAAGIAVSATCEDYVRDLTEGAL